MSYNVAVACCAIFVWVGRFYGRAEDTIMQINRPPEIENRQLSDSGVGNIDKDEQYDAA